MNPKWYALSADEAVRKLNSNAAAGISHMAARLRYGKKRLSGERDFFYIPQKPFSSLFSVCLSDFSFWILLLTCGALSFFEETRLAAVGVVFLVLHLLFSAISVKWASSLVEGFSFGFVPKVKVVREGVLCVTDYRCIVRGDIVLLSEGDVIPFDARIIRACDFVVSTYCGKTQAGENSFLRTEKCAEKIFPPYRDLLPEDRANMVTAGSTVLGGNARVIVVETGSYTYAGALSGGMPLARPDRKSKFDGPVIRQTRLIGIFLLLLAIPLTAFSYLLGEPRNLALSFLTVFSLSSAASAGWIRAIFDISAARSIYRVVRQDGALLRTIAASEALSSANVLMLFGKEMITDGLPHISAVFSEGCLFRGEKMNAPACRALTEKALLIATANDAKLTSGDMTDANAELYRKELLHYAEFARVDREMLRIRYRMYELRVLSSEPRLWALRYGDTAKSSPSKSCLLYANNAFLLLRCTHEADEKGIRVLSVERRERIQREMNVCLANGCELHYYAEKQTDGTVVFLGFIAVAERIQKESSETFSSLSSAGVRTILFLNGEGVTERYYIRACGCCRSDREIALASDFRKKGKQICDGFENYTAYLGFSREEITVLVRTLEQNGLKTAVVGTSYRDIATLNEASVSLVCGEFSSYTRHSDRRRISEMPLEGAPSGTVLGEAALSADGIVRRASHNGGGVSALFHAILRGRQTDRNRHRFLRYAITVFGLRFGWLLPILAGADTPYSALCVLFGGFILDIAAGFMILSDGKTFGATVDLPSESEKRNVVLGADVRSALISATVGFLLSLLPCFFWLMGIDGNNAACLSFREISLILASAVCLFRVRSNRKQPLFDRAMGLYSVFLLLFIAVALFLPSVGALVGIFALPGITSILLPLAVCLPLIIPTGDRY